MRAPTDRSIKVTVIPSYTLVSHHGSMTCLLTHETAASDAWNVAASSVNVMETVKKSNASQVQPRKPTVNINHWWSVNSLKI